MAKKTARKVLKKYPYVAVEGMENQYVDACFLVNFSAPHICELLEDEKKVILKSGLSLLKLKRREYSKQELIQAAAPHIHESYPLYNFLAGCMNNVLEEVEGDIDGFLEMTDEEKADTLLDHVREGELTGSICISWLRFHQDMHHRIEEAFEVYGQEFEDESGIRLPEHLQIERIEENREEGNEFEQHFERILAELAELRVHYKKHSFKEEYEIIAKEHDSLQAQLKQEKEAGKSKEKQLVKLQQQVTKLQRQLEDEQGKTGQKQKEAGQLGKELGELRAEAEKLRKENEQLKKNAAQQKEKVETAVQRAKTEAEQEWKKQEAALRLSLQTQLQEERMKVGILQKSATELVQLTEKLEAAEDELRIVQSQLQYYRNVAEQRAVQRQEQITLELDLETNELVAATKQQVEEAPEPVEEDFDFEDMFGDLPINEPKRVGK